MSSSPVRRVESSPIGSPVTFVSGQFAGLTLRGELEELQKADLGRKYARKDRRPLDPPPVVQFRLFEVLNPGTLSETEREFDNYDEIKSFGVLCHVDLFRIPGDDDVGGDLSDSANGSEAQLRSCSTLPARSNTPTSRHNPYDSVAYRSSPSPPYAVPSLLPSSLSHYTGSTLPAPNGSSSSGLYSPSLLSPSSLAPTFSSPTPPVTTTISHSYSLPAPALPPTMSHPFPAPSHSYSLPAPAPSSNMLHSYPAVSYSFSLSAPTPLSSMSATSYPIPAFTPQSSMSQPFPIAAPMSGSSMSQTYSLQGAVPSASISQTYSLPAPAPPSLGLHMAGTSTWSDYTSPAFAESSDPRKPFSLRQVPDAIDADIVAYCGNYAIKESSKCTHMLAGATFVQSAGLEYKGRKVLMFVFSDLAVKAEGTFLLRYRVFNIFSKTHGDAGIPILAECYGGPFKIYSTKEFPGLRASTDLTKHISFFGVRLNLRENERKRRKKSEIEADNKAVADAAVSSSAPSSSPTLSTSSVSTTEGSSGRPSKGKRRQSFQDRSSEDDVSGSRE